MKNVSLKTLAGIAVLAALVACDSTDKSKQSDGVAAVAAVAAPEAPTISASQPAQGLAAPFSEEVMSLAVGGNCALDTVDGVQVANGSLELKRSTPATVGGWVADASGAVPADPVLVVHNDTARYAVKFATGIARADVAEVMKSPALATAGFETPVVLSDVPAGTYDLSIVLPGSTAQRCPLNVVLTLKD